MIFGTPPLPTEPSIEEVADWAELVALRRGKLMRGNLTSNVTRMGGSDTLVADAWTELEQRADLSKEHWTFTVSSTRLEPRMNQPDQHVLPAFFAALGLRENIENSHRTVFEQCVAELILGMLPEGMRIGSPRRLPVAPSFRKAFADYASRIDEEIVCEPPSSDNDLKMDVVAWRRFGDRRGGYLHLVGQCATGADWDSKLEELNLEVIQDHLNWGVLPVRFFATPYVVPVQHLRRVSKRGGLILDRPRLLELERTSPLVAETKREVADLLGVLY